MRSCFWTVWNEVNNRSDVFCGDDQRSLPSLQNIIAEHEIRNISCAAQDPEDLSTFAYITKDLKSSHHYCHVFTAFDVVSAEAAARPVSTTPSVTTFSRLLLPSTRTWRTKSS